MSFVMTRACGAVALLSFAIAAPAQAPRPAALARVAPGAWTVHEIGSTLPPSPICVRDPALLLHLAHGQATCSQTIVEEGPRRATVQYSCPGAGRGRTSITVEDDDLVRVQTQGLLRGAPFDLDYEVRRTGECAPGRR